MDRWWQRFYNRVTAILSTDKDKTKIKAIIIFEQQRPKELPDIDRQALKLATEA